MASVSALLVCSKTGQQFDELIHHINVFPLRYIAGRNVNPRIQSDSFFQLGITSFSKRDVVEDEGSPSTSRERSASNEK
jgi:hypothetical protein